MRRVVRCRPLEQDGKLLFPDILMRAFFKDELLHGIGDATGASSFWRRALGDEGFSPAAAVLLQLLPPEECCSGDMKRLFGGCIPVLLPEREDAGAFRGFMGNHIPEA